jgi:hypothetical protein
MKQIPLTQGKFAIVDDEDFDWLNKWKWCVNNENVVHRKSNYKIITMHKLIMNPPKGMQVDHKSGNRLDNRRSNLRICTGSQNCMNRNYKSNSSGYKGVRKWYRRWQSRIEINGKKINLGMFSTPIKAAKAYNEAAIKYHGEFAKLNQI